MDIDEFIGLLHTIGVDVNAPVLKNWAYSNRVIEAPTPHGRGSGIRGRSASWNKDDIPNVAAVYAVRHHPTVKYRPMLELVPYIKQAVQMLYENEMPPLGYDAKAGITSYEQIKFSLQGRPEFLRERLSDESWQALLTTWIAAKEKAKKGKQIDKPYQVRFHWLEVEKDGGVERPPKKVNGDNVSLHELKLGPDEIIIMINGEDYRKTVFKVLRFASPKDFP